MLKFLETWFFASMIIFTLGLTGYVIFRVISDIYIELVELGLYEFISQPVVGPLFIFLALSIVLGCIISSFIFYKEHMEDQRWD